MASISSKALFGIGIAMTVAAISSIFVVMVAAQDQEQAGQEGSTNGGSQQQQAVNNTTRGGQTTTTIAIPDGAAAQQVDRYYQPDPAQVQSGSEVTWENQDSAPHTATADDGSFDTGNIAAGSSGSATVQGQGEIPYHCTIHPFMTATIQVVSEGQQTSQNTQQDQQGNITQGQNTTRQNQTETAQQSQVETQSLEELLQQAGRLLTQAGNVLQQAASNQTVTTEQNGQQQQSSNNATQIANATQAHENQSQNMSTRMASTVTILQGSSSNNAEQFYQPDPAQVQSGSEVTWENEDSVSHTATARDGSFDTGNIPAGQSGSSIIQGQGEIEYYCTIHPYMTGTLNVVLDNPGQVDAAEVQNQTQIAQQSKEASDHPQALLDLSPNELARALEQIAQSYQQAAAALQGISSETQTTTIQQNQTSVARNDSATAPVPDTDVPTSNATKDETRTFNQTAAQPQQPSRQLNGTLLSEARQAITSLIEQLENINGTQQ